MKIVAFQGEHGAFSEAAAFGYFGKRIKTLPLESFDKVFAAVGKTADYGIMPIENSIEGGVLQACDLLIESELRVVGEFVLRVRHCLIADPDTRLKDIKYVYSHVQALGQCRRYIHEMKFIPVAYIDTAGSVKMLKERHLADSAAIASEEAAKIYGLRILKKGIETDKRNYTRFLILAKKSNGIGQFIKKNKRGATKVALTFSTGNKPGMLYDALGRFAKHGINLTYIQSRPILGMPWKYNFYIECQLNRGKEGFRETLGELERGSFNIKLLGYYKNCKR
jgi:prephenate dehydratase